MKLNRQRSNIVSMSVQMISEKEAGSADRNGIPKACMEMFDILAERLALMQPPDQHVQRAEISVEDMLNPGFSSELARLYGFPQLVTSPEDRTEATPLMSGKSQNTISMTFFWYTISSLTCANHVAALICRPLLRHILPCSWKRSG